jgi:hypothetical protein
LAGVGTIARRGGVLMSGLDDEQVVLAGIDTGIMVACRDEVMPGMAYVCAVARARACAMGRVTRQDAVCILHAPEQAIG